MSTKANLCWEGYAEQVSEWYATTYRHRNDAMRDSDIIKKVIMSLNSENYEQEVSYVATVCISRGASTYASRTCELYMKNTCTSYMTRCVEETGGFSPAVRCRSDKNCPGGYRCRGVGEDSECVKEGKPYVPEPSLPGLPGLPGLPSIGVGDAFGGVKKSAQTAAIVLMVFIGLLIYLIFVKGRGAQGVTVVGK